MKKQIVIILSLSLLQFQLAASDYELRKEFIDSSITKELINFHWNGFFKHTENQIKLMQRYSWLGKRLIAILSGWFGYNEFSKRLLCIGDLILDKNWHERLTKFKIEYGEYELLHMNQTKKYVNEHMTAEYNTNDALNQSIYLIHQHNIDTIQNEEHIDNAYATILKENEQKINGEYPMYDYISKYKEQHDGQVPKTTIPNMLLAYLLYYYKITPKGS